MSEPLIVIGNGMAAARLVEELAKRALGRYAVAVTPAGTAGLWRTFRLRHPKEGRVRLESG